MPRVFSQPDSYVPSSYSSNNGSPGGLPLAGVQGAEPPGLAVTSDRR